MKTLLLLLSLFAFAAAKAQPISTPNFIELAGLSPYTKYKTFETAHFILIFPQNYFNFSKVAAAELEHAHQILSPILKWEPRQKTRVLVTDTEDAANGFAMPALRVGLVLIATPPETWFSTAHEENWIKLLAFHEYVHMLNIDPTTGWLELARLLFGDVIRPNGLWPVWMLEGLAVYYETKTSILGRGRSPYYEGILRSFVLEDQLNNHNNFGMTLDRVNGDFPAFPGGEIQYLFGYHLWQELGRNRTDIDSLAGEYSLRSSHRVPFFINGNLENLTNHSWDDYWFSFSEYTRKRMNEQIQKIKSQGDTKFEPVTHSEYSALGGAFSKDGKWLAWNETNLKERPGLYLKDQTTGTVSKIEDKILGISLSFTPDSKWLIYSSLRRFKTYNLYSDLFAYNLATHKTIQLTEGKRVKDPHVSADGTKIVFTQNKDASNVIGTADLISSNDNISLSNVRIAYSPKEFSIIGTPRFLDQSNTEVVLSLHELGNQFADLVQVKVSDGKSSVLFHDGNLNYGPFPTSKGIYFSSNKSGIENIYLLNQGTAKPVTNIITGAQLPFTSVDGALHASLITSKGLEIVKFADQKPNFELPTVLPEAPTTFPNALAAVAPINVNAVNYSPWSSLAPRQWAPIAYFEYQSYSGFYILGEMLGFDATGKHQYFADAGYHFKTKTLDGGLAYTYYGFRPEITLSANAYTKDIAADYYEAQYRRVFEVAVQFEWPIQWTFSSLRPRLYGFMDWNRIRNISTGEPVATRLYEYSHPIIPGAGASLLYSNIEESKLGFMPEAGIQLYSATEARFNEQIHPIWKYLASATTYHELWEHSVLQPKVKYVATTHHLGSENTSILLEDGNGVTLDKAGVRGYPKALFYTHGVFVGSLDFHFPISNIFSGAGTFPAFMKQLHGFVFAESAFVPSARYKDLYFPSAGGGLILDTTLLIRAPVNFVAQVQNGFRKDRGGDFIFSWGITSIPLAY